MQTKSNNEGFRALFTLPPIKDSASTAVAAPEMPQIVTVTGDREVDAVLWLQSIVGTGSQALIDKAMEAVKLIKTPMKILEDRYAAHLRSSGAHPLQIVFGTVGFGDLEEQAKRAIETSRNRHEALARFGNVESLAKDTPAEEACRKALRGLKRGVADFYDDEQARERFSRNHDLVPATIDDCLYARVYWSKLYRLRNATAEFGDPLPQGYAHESYCLAMLARIMPRDFTEAESAFDHLYESDSSGAKEGKSILRNLIASGWDAKREGVLREKRETQSEVKA
ncbi:hypothetical protein [Cupriavidus basilensis]|uniref:hypothetical protein n=1 Tax=Cupriavidus basilensis TaxID=68895 RepID=UPI0020A667FE|nr:hypothetical protein [Cupriavidus basilensis]MCP3022273.1 hypothetical protein [Cupriavidus basilensis]